MAKTSIEWTDHSINPIRARNTLTDAVGHYCEMVNTGCANCYASNLQKRFGMPEYRGQSGHLNFIEPSRQRRGHHSHLPTRRKWWMLRAGNLCLHRPTAIRGNNEGHQKLARVVRGGTSKDQCGVSEVIEFTVHATLVASAAAPTTTRTHMQEVLKSPYPYFGGKSTIAPLIWERFGDVENFVEPFLGSAAVLLARPNPTGIETVNDADGLVCNFWRAVEADPDAVAEYADWPVIENDLHARHAWLVGRKDSLQEQLEGDPDYYDVKVAGWWVWGMACWIGSGFCAGEGPWRVEDGRLQKLGPGQGVTRQRPHLSDAGRGVQRASIDSLHNYFAALANRLRLVRVCCGDWSRVCGPSVTIHAAGERPTAVYLDPPYSAEAGRDMELYRVECGKVAHDVRAWCLANGNDKRLRIILSGYEGEHEELEQHGWEVVAWKANGGMANQGNNRGRDNAKRERLWISPHCVKPTPGLFG